MAVRELVALRNRFLDVFRAEADQRGSRPGMVTAPGHRYPERAWQVAEREAMWRLVDEQRRQRGLPPVTLGAVERVETFASGHIDYADKFALYCAELVLDERNENGLRVAAGGSR